MQHATITTFLNVCNLLNESVRVFGLLLFFSMVIGTFYLVVLALFTSCAFTFIPNQRRKKCVCMARNRLFLSMNIYNMYTLTVSYSNILKTFVLAYTIDFVHAFSVALWYSCYFSCFFSSSTTSSSSYRFHKMFGYIKNNHRHIVSGFIAFISFHLFAALF